MQIKKVTVEYDEKTYVAEGMDAESWLGWMLQAESLMRSHSQWEWNSWTRIETHGEQVGHVPDGPDGPVEPA